MGEVYLARDTSLGRPVALKLLPSEVSQDKDRMARFVQEARAASQLNHPGVTHVYEIGQQDEVWFIAMEYVEGETLERKMRSHRLDPFQVCGIGAQVADALALAHSRGVIHRDIKPANVMIDTRGQAKVLDFGIAKVQPSVVSPVGDEQPTAPWTTVGVVVGTVNYMSPEQALGRDIDHRSDIFSLGVLLYEAVTGQSPFAGKTQAEIVDRIIHSEPAAAAALNPDVPADLERMIAKCLRKDPADRYQSASDLAADLAYLLKRQPVSGPASSTVDSEYYLPRALARTLMILIQSLYVVLYVAAFRWHDEMDIGFEYLFGRLGGVATVYYLASAMPGMALRLYLASLIIFDHVRTGVRFSQLFPFLLILDGTWAALPLCVAQAWGPAVALAGVPLLAFLPISQRTLVRSAYDLSAPRRTTTGPRPVVIG